MRTKNNLVPILFVLTALTISRWAWAGRDEHRVLAPPGRNVDVVIALDVSSSMDGLVDSARSRLWDMVNLLSKMKPRPTVRVGLISYGNDFYDSSRGWIRKESELTSDLDLVYSKLFALTTNGGTEYVARAVRDATAQMNWTTDDRDLRLIFVAGNEPADQDPEISLASALHDAERKGILVNTIYCGSASNSESALWHQVAERGHGKYAAIDQNHVVTIATPMDQELGRLSSALNDTYLAYGDDGENRKRLQEEQDKNAAHMSAPAAAARTVAKGGALYRNDSWDVVDALKNGKSLDDLRAALPAPIQAMKPAEQKAYVEKRSVERARLQKQISEVASKREGFLRAEKAKRSTAAPADLNDALDGALRDAATAKGFAF